MRVIATIAIAALAIGMLYRDKAKWYECFATAILVAFVALGLLLM